MAARTARASQIGLGLAALIAAACGPSAAGRAEIPQRPGRAAQLRRARRLEEGRPRRGLRDLPEKLQRDPARQPGDARRRGRSTARCTRPVRSARRAARPARPRRGARLLRGQFQAGAHLAGVHSYGYYTGADGFFTGYYEPKSTARASRPTDYKVPLYRVPANVIAGKKSTVFVAIRSHRDRGRRAGRQGPGDLLGEESGRCLLRADPGLDARQARRRPAAAAQLHRQQRQALHAGRPPADRRGIVHARRNVDGQDPRIHGGQSERGQGAAARRTAPTCSSARRRSARRRAARRAGHPADAGALARGRSHDPRLRHADLDRRQIADHERAAERHLPPSDDRAGYRLGHPRARRAPTSISATARTSRTSPAASSSSANSSCWCRKGVSVTGTAPEPVEHSAAAAAAEGNRRGAMRRRRAGAAQADGHERRQPAPRSHLRGARAVDDRHQGDRAAARERASRRAGARSDAGAATLKPARRQADAPALRRCRRRAKPARRRRWRRSAAA